MKTNLLNFVLVFFTLTIAINITGCEEDEEIKTLTVDKENQNVTNEAGSLTINVTSNTDWSVTASNTWCTVSADATSNNGVITVNYEKNLTEEERTCNIVITGTDVAEVTIVIKQSAGVKKSFPSKLSHFFINSPEYNRVEDYTYDEYHNFDNMVGSDNSKTEYEYNDNNLLIKASYYVDNELTNYFIYEYNSNNKVETRSYYNDNGTGTFEKKSWQTYDYNDDEVIKITTYDINGDETGYYDFEYNDGNLTKETRYNILDDNSYYKRYESSYTYDDKHYTFVNINTKVEPIEFNTNNYTLNSWVFYDQYGNVSTSFETNYTYEYNGDDFPTKRTKNGEDYINYEYIKEF